MVGSEAMPRLRVDGFQDVLGCLYYSKNADMGTEMENLPLCCDVP